MNKIFLVPALTELTTPDVFQLCSSKYNKRNIIIIKACKLVASEQIELIGMFFIIICSVFVKIINYYC